MHTRDVNEQEAHSVQSVQTDAGPERLVHRREEQNLHDRHVESRDAELRALPKHIEIC